MIRMFFINRIALNVSSLESVDFYKSLGFEEKKDDRKENEGIVLLEGYSLLLELHIIKDLKKNTNDSYGLKNICIRVDKLESNYQVDEEGKFRILHDPDGLEIFVREIPYPSPSGDWNFSE
ncbi:MAG: hypothetical protein J6X93_06390 [Bacilli bacterium]|nr:hypothetical protein [Bacilli bacterium]